MPRKHLLLSVRPQHAQGIFAGTKTVELRRRRPRIEAGDTVWVYASSPQKALLGTFQVASVISGAPAALWERVGALAAVSREAFNAYYQGASHAHAILIGRVMPLGQALPLARLRDQEPGFRPPQSYRYLDDVEAWMVGELSERQEPE